MAVARWCSVVPGNGSILEVDKVLDLGKSVVPDHERAGSACDTRGTSDPAVESSLAGFVDDGAAAGLVVPLYILDALRCVRSWILFVIFVEPLSEEVQIFKKSEVTDWRRSCREQGGRTRHVAAQAKKFSDNLESSLATSGPLLLLSQSELDE